MIAILNFIITKLEKHTRDKKKRETYRKILSAIDQYMNEVKGMVVIRYYKYFSFNVDDLEQAAEEKILREKFDEFFDI